MEFKTNKQKSFQIKILYSTKWFFKNDGELKIFPGKDWENLLLSEMPDVKYLRKIFWLKKKNHQKVTNPLLF